MRKIILIAVLLLFGLTAVASADCYFVSYSNCKDITRCGVLTAYFNAQYIDAKQLTYTVTCSDGREITESGTVANFIAYPPIRLGSGGSLISKYDSYAIIKYVVNTVANGDAPCDISRDPASNSLMHVQNAPFVHVNIITQPNYATSAKEFRFDSVYDAPYPYLGTYLGTFMETLWSQGDDRFYAPYSPSGDQYFYQAVFGYYGVACP